MGNEKKDTAETLTQTQPAKTEAIEKLPASAYELPKKYLLGDTHYGLAITLSSSGEPSTIMVPDVTKVSDGDPVYITGRIQIKGTNLKAFLADKGVKLPDAIDRLIGATSISCDAFYYSTKKVEFTKEGKNKEKYKELQERFHYADDDPDWIKWLLAHRKGTETPEKYEIDEGPLLIMFSIKFDNGLIGTLAGDEHLGNLFDVTGGSLRILRCPPNCESTLQDYVKMLQ